MPLKKRVRPFLVAVFFLLTIACGPVSDLITRPTPISQLQLALVTEVTPTEAVVPPTIAATATHTVAPTQTSTPVPTETHTPAPTNTAEPTVPPTAEPTATPNDIYLNATDIRFHPAPCQYSGDSLSVEVFVENWNRFDPKTIEVALYAGSGDERTFLDNTIVSPFGIGGRMQATFYWAWDTTNLEGPQDLTIVLDPDDRLIEGDEDEANNTVTTTVLLQPDSVRPGNEAGGTWETVETDCCSILYTTNTAAARDIDTIVPIINDAVAHAEADLNIQLEEKIQINLLNRVLGHGGFASGTTMSITYIDRQYSGGQLWSVIAHETSHILDRKINAKRPTLLTEGLAVYVAGGHFKKEPLVTRIAAVLDDGDFIPFDETFVNNFYDAQHEISYLQAGALVQYLIERNGEETFFRFLRTLPEEGTHYERIRDGLRIQYQLSFEELETEWRAWLEDQPKNELWADDIRNTVNFYDTVRRYQSFYDQDAYFLSAWLPSIRQTISDNNVAEFTRHPATPENVTLELMLVEAENALQRGEQDKSTDMINRVNQILDRNELPDPFAVDPVAINLYQIVQQIMAAGYEPQFMETTGVNEITIHAIDNWPTLTTIPIEIGNFGDWKLAEELVPNDDGRFVSCN